MKKGDARAETAERHGGRKILIIRKQIFLSPNCQ